MYNKLIKACRIQHAFEVERNYFRQKAETFFVTKPPTSEKLIFVFASYERTKEG